jgi:hypothetical protein
MRTHDHARRSQDRVGWLEMAPPVIAIALSILALAQVRQLRAADESLAQMHAHRSDLLRVADLVGTTLPLGPHPRIEPGAEPTADYAIWILNPQTCVGCLASIGEWNALDADRRFSPRVVFVGVDADSVHLLKSRYRLEGSVVSDPTGSFGALLGASLSSLKIHAAADGTIRWADARVPTSCRISFEGIVASVAAAQATHKRRMTAWEAHRDAEERAPHEKSAQESQGGVE